MWTLPILITYQNGISHSCYIFDILVGLIHRRWHRLSPTFLVVISSNTIYNVPIEGLSDVTYTPKRLVNDWSSIRTL